jgi:hypothetical protein
MLLSVRCTSAEEYFNVGTYVSDFHIAEIGLQIGACYGCVHTLEALLQARAFLAHSRDTFAGLAAGPQPVLSSPEDWDAVSKLQKADEIIGENERNVQYEELLKALGRSAV